MAAVENNIAKPSVEPLASIFAATPADLSQLLTSWDEPKFRVKQLQDWIFKERVYNLEQMTNLSKSLRERLARYYDWSFPIIEDRIDSEDGTTKLLLLGEKNQVIETVIMRYENRTSLCVSSQVGCKLACRFCQTGKLGFFRNLSAAEIMTQFCLANSILRPEDRKITHVVFMGMGEPLDNFENVVAAVNLLTGKDTYMLSARKVTVSTSGIATKITQLAERCNASLAISLHAARDVLRSELMPINRKYNLESLKTSLLEYQRLTGDKITFEYILIKDKTCGRKEAKELVHFLHGLKAKINLIPFNPHPGLDYMRPSEDEIREFQSYLTARSFAAPVRYSRGGEVSAACGQLAAKREDAIMAEPKRKNAISQVDFR
ncbi:MAG: 23S rRNA (adenine(2503)-C(2))-methyltransferase RlmN [Bdellovibrionota bacterium]